MKEIFEYIKDVFLNLQGIFASKDRYVPEELEDIYAQVFLNDDFRPAYFDKINMHSDVHHIRQDFKKAHLKYKEEVLHG